MLVVPTHDYDSAGQFLTFMNGYSGEFACLSPLLLGAHIS
jgi:hypothetical protein